MTTKDPNRPIPRSEIVAALRESRPAMRTPSVDPFEAGLGIGHHNRWTIMVAHIAAMLGENKADLEAECVGRGKIS